MQNLKSWTTLLFVGVFSFGIRNVTSYSVSQIGDVRIENDGTTFKCDKIICPKEATHCQVIKQNDPNNSSILVRRNICFAQNGNIILDNTTNESTRPGWTEHLNVVVSNDGYSSSSVSLSGNEVYNGAPPNFDFEGLQRDIQANVQRTLEEVDRNLRQSLGGWWRGF